jgi:hypothetical protein
MNCPNIIHTPNTIYIVLFPNIVMNIPPMKGNTTLGNEYNEYSRLK